MNRYEFTNGELVVSSVETKTKEDLLRVINSGRPAKVIKAFARMYAESIADPDQRLKDIWYEAYNTCEYFNEVKEGKEGFRNTVSVDGVDSQEAYWIKEPRELTEEEQEEFDAALETYLELEDGYIIPAKSDPETGEIYSEEEVVAGTPWLKSLRGVEDAPVAPTVEVALASVVLSSIKEYKVQARESAMGKLTVTTESGKVFDADEASQARMSRAVLFGEAGEIMPWILADNSIGQVTYEELKEAGRLAGLAQTEVWFLN